METRKSRVPFRERIFAMPRNRLMYYGTLIVTASALIWLGAWLTKRVEWILPYTGVIGVVLIVIGVAMEARNRRLAPISEEAIGVEKPPRPTRP